MPRWDYYIVLFAFVFPIYGITALCWANVTLAIRDFIIRNGTMCSLPRWRVIALFWSAAECAFSVYYYRTSKRLQHRVLPPSLSPQEMNRIFFECCSHATEITATLSLWFNGAHVNDLRKENIREYLGWAFYDKYLDELTVQEVQTTEGMIRILEQKIGSKLENGYNSNVNCMRMTLDPFTSLSRPLVVYGIVSVADLVMGLYLSYQGFRRMQCGHLSYWMRPGSYIAQDKSLKQSPIIFVHGIGIGLAAYVSFIRKFITKFEDRDILLLELPHVSMRLDFYVPTMSETLFAIDHLFKQHQITKATWIGHSFGTIIAGWVAKRRPKYIEQLLLIDPICFMLWEPYTVLNFVYRKPTSGLELMRWYLLQTELGISRVVCRAFWWHEALLFPHQLPQKLPTFVFISGGDRIVHGPRLRTYLERYNMNIIYWANAPHADFIIRTDKQYQILKCI
ncbi:uncharacterized protein VTP21DRAFT_8406 [Calcarisporiella thermophila]|uniref:uncharacterized protein n=1 Tax=Calcarisporiella thermophila TaxID=911321 RepID=UPI0037431E0F